MSSPPAIEADPLLTDRAHSAARTALDRIGPRSTLVGRKETALSALRTLVALSPVCTGRELAPSDARLEKQFVGSSTGTAACWFEHTA